MSNPNNVQQAYAAYPGAQPQGYPGAQPQGYPGAQPQGYPNRGVSDMENGNVAYGHHGPHQVFVSSSSDVHHNTKEDSDYYLNEFTEIKIRHDFLKKVFGLLAICLSVAFGMCLAGNLVPAYQQWLFDNSWISIVGAVMMLVLSMLIICNKKLAEKVPINYFLLFGYALSTGFVLSFIGATYDPKTISMAIGTTLAISIACMLFACQVKYDFTKWYPYAMVGVMGMFMMGLIGWFIRSPVYHIVYGSIGVVLFSFLLILDTQMIVGGKRAVQFTIDMYIVAVVTLFCDIINIFLYLLRILGALEE